MELQVNSITHQISLAAGLGIIVYAGLANWDDWKEFLQYFRESKFVSVVNHWCIYITDIPIDGKHYAHLDNQIPTHVEWWVSDNEFQWNCWTFSSSPKISNHKFFAHWFKSRMQVLMSCALYVQYIRSFFRQELISFFIFFSSLVILNGFLFLIFAIS